jgi:RNA polymerase II-associated factor 1
MVVDAECGMPLDLGKWEALWEDGADDSGAQTAASTPRPFPFLTKPPSLTAPLVPPS